MNPEEPVDRNQIVPLGTARTVYRRRISILRAATVALVTSVALIFFILWYRAYPQRLDCIKIAQRVTIALEEYRVTNKVLPPLLEMLSVKPGRYSIDHFDYYFTGIGAPPILPDETLIAYCDHPHRALFIEPWRSVILFEKGHVTYRMIPENLFQEMRNRQRPPEKY